jgi:hypothetical protein
MCITKDSDQFAFVTGPRHCVECLKGFEMYLLYCGQMKNTVQVNK